MGRLGLGCTMAASVQKSAGRSASSGGEVRSITRSLVLRSLARSARPRAGRSLLFEGFEVRFTLTSVAQPGRDDPAHDPATGPGPVGVDHGECEPLSKANSDDPSLAVVPARVVRAPAWGRRKRASRTRNPILALAGCGHSFGGPSRSAPTQHTVVYTVAQARPPAEASRRRPPTRRPPFPAPAA